MIDDNSDLEMITEDREDDEIAFPIKRPILLCFSITSFIFAILFFALIFVVWFIPIDTPNPEMVVKVSDYFDTIIQPIDSLLYEIENITNSFGRMDYIGQGFADGVYDTFAQINNSLDTDMKAFLLLADALDGFVDSLEGINDSILGFLINDTLVANTRTLVTNIKSLEPAVYQIKYFFTGMAHNFKAFMGSIDSIYGHLHSLRPYLLKIDHVFQSLSQAIQIANEKSEMIVGVWFFVQIGSICLCILFSVLSFIIGVYFFKRYNN